ncbi:ABC-type transport system involved in multi-copper enzyme maturation, permease component [Sanguibacter gelidistatuariae]|uniref:ABC-type transport system involved in multi-copper enzyme maturation, permease component n=1 Tax=Sanguibacter gelidistatuariae TaxID=1814289 RepID=A0A1G6GN34_9MICO|nr:ABC transporter permease [Sanguibacter gelidistatuariae]SDB83349.1 ABC-type transport system involved in multi-copper enzyme maturation, permease component [Sanguibacter gelidistatuariae]
MTAFPYPAAPPKHPALPPALRPRGTWSLSWHGVRTVAKLELTQRLRSTKWKVALGVWFLVVGGICLLISTSVNYENTGLSQPGPLMFSLNVMFILSMGLLITPTLSSAAINGDRIAGTLAILQVTLLTPIEITLGKLLAGWLASLAFVVISVPFILWSFLAGGVAVGAVFSTLVLLTLMLGVVSAVSLGFSALTTKPTGSTVLSYLTVAFLTVGTLILFAVTLFPMSGTEQYSVQQASEWDNKSGDVVACEWQDTTQSVAHTERTWWLLAINPYVVVADAAPGREAFNGSSADPLAAIRDGVRSARAGAGEPYSTCPASISGVEEIDPSTAPVWPLGLAVNLLLGAGAVVLTVRRLRIPQGKLARGTRVA